MNTVTWSTALSTLSCSFQWSCTSQTLIHIPEVITGLGGRPHRSFALVFDPAQQREMSRSRATRAGADASRPEPSTGHWIHPAERSHQDEETTRRIFRRVVPFRAPHFLPPCRKVPKSWAIGPALPAASPWPVGLKKLRGRNACERQSERSCPDCGNGAGYFSLKEEAGALKGGSSARRERRRRDRPLL